MTVFPPTIPSQLVFFLLLCKGILTHRAAHLGAVNTETGFEKRRRRGNLVNLRAVHGVHVERARLCRLFSRRTSQHWGKCISHPALKSILSGRSLRLTVSQEEDEILRDLLIEGLYGQRVLQGPLGPVVPKLGIFLRLCT